MNTLGEWQASGSNASLRIGAVWLRPTLGGHLTVADHQTTKKGRRVVRRPSVVLASVPLSGLLGLDLDSGLARGYLNAAGL